MGVDAVFDQQLPPPIPVSGAADLLGDQRFGLAVVPENPLTGCPAAGIEFLRPGEQVLHVERGHSYHARSPIPAVAAEIPTRSAWPATPRGVTARPGRRRIGGGGRRGGGGRDRTRPASAGAVAADAG